VEKNRIEPARQISLSARSICPTAADRFYSGEHLRINMVIEPAG
jgi:hypothetical protein